MKNKKRTKKKRKERIHSKRNNSAKQKHLFNFSWIKKSVLVVFEIKIFLNDDSRLSIILT